MSKGLTSVNLIVQIGRMSKEKEMADVYRNVSLAVLAFNCRDEGKRIEGKGKMKIENGNRQINKNQFPNKPNSYKAMLQIQFLTRHLTKPIFDL